MEDTMAGGCLCGAVRYTVNGPIQGEIAHCHCSMCRRASGAPVLTWFTVKKEDFEVVKGEPRSYKSSDHARRSFCGDCGTPLTFISEHDPAFVDLTLGSLDRPEDYPATQHVWTMSRLSWLHLDEDLPDHPKGGGLL